MNRNQRKQARNALKMRRCRYCLATDGLTIDHKKPKSEGGTDALSNLQCLCKKCNGMKGGLSHRRVLGLFRWAEYVNSRRKSNNKKPYIWLSK